MDESEPEAVNSPLGERQPPKKKRRYPRRTDPTGSLERRRQREEIRRSYLNEAFEKLELLLYEIDPSIRIPLNVVDTKRKMVTSLPNRPSMINHAASLVLQYFEENKKITQNILTYIQENPVEDDDVPQLDPSDTKQEEPAQDQIAATARQVPCVSHASVPRAGDPPAGASALPYSTAQGLKGALLQQQLLQHHTQNIGLMQQHLKPSSASFFHSMPGAISPLLAHAPAALSDHNPLAGYLPNAAPQSLLQQQLLQALIAREVNTPLTAPNLTSRVGSSPNWVPQITTQQAQHLEYLDLQRALRSSTRMNADQVADQSSTSGDGYAQYLRMFLLKDPDQP